MAPAELEAHLLTHPLVDDCAVIAIAHPSSGEVPRAFVVLKAGHDIEQGWAAELIQKHVQDHKARHKWLKGGVRFIRAIPKSPSGKILRRQLRDIKKNESRSSRSKM